MTTSKYSVTNLLNIQETSSFNLPCNQQNPVKFEVGTDGMPEPSCQLYSSSTLSLSLFLSLSQPPSLSFFYSLPDPIQSFSLATFSFWIRFDWCPSYAHSRNLCQHGQKLVFHHHPSPSSEICILRPKVFVRAQTIKNISSLVQWERGVEDELDRSTAYHVHLPIEKSFQTLAEPDLISNGNSLRPALGHDNESVNGMGSLSWEPLVREFEICLSSVFPFFPDEQPSTANPYTYANTILPGSNTEINHTGDGSEPVADAQQLDIYRDLILRHLIQDISTTCAGLGLPTGSFSKKFPIFSQHCSIVFDHQNSHFSPHCLLSLFLPGGVFSPLTYIW